MSENKLCPVCGEKARINTELAYRPIASCDNPECWMFCLGYHLEDWNKPRPIEDALRAENAKLRAALESLRRGDKEHDSYCKYDGQDGLYFCTCSARNTNAIIDAALKGDG